MSTNRSLDRRLNTLERTSVPDYTNSIVIYDPDACPPATDGREGVTIYLPDNGRSPLPPSGD